MRRKRVTGRFYLFLLVVAAIVFFLLRRYIPWNSAEAIVKVATSTYTNTVDAVIVRDETVVSYEGNGRVVYIAGEGDAVAAGQEVAAVYSASYSETEMKKLETVRTNIRTYHQTILDNIVDPALERLERNVQSKAVELKTLVQTGSTGSLLNVERQLEEAMVARQDYLRENRREDPKLNQLYEEESKRVNSIASWRISELAPKSGVVSFYLDGCERFLTPENLSKLTIADVRSILAGNIPATEGNSRLRQDVYRLVVPDKWYVLLIASGANWNPISGQTIAFQIEGFEDVVYEGDIVLLQKTGNDVLVQLEVTDDIGPMRNQRAGRANIGINLAGLSVPTRAIDVQSGQTGVWLGDVAGGTFIPVDVLSSDSENALIQPQVENSLMVGQRILIK